MANINIKKAVDRISDDINAAVSQAVIYSGINEKDAAYIEKYAEQIAEQAARLVGLARVVNKHSLVKHKPDEDLRLVKKVRKAFGYNG